MGNFLARSRCCRRKESWDSKNGVANEKKERGDENKDRGNWSRQLDFVLSCIGYAVGLGNLWRFPYLCMRNGGGAFLIPYFIFLFLCGIPLFFVELAVGQFSSSSPISVWNICPLFKGIGYGMVIVSGIVCIYFNVVITWVLYYLGLSFTTDVPWGSCDNEWNTPRCYQRVRQDALPGNSSSTLNFNSTLNTTLGPILSFVNTTYATVSSNNTGNVTEPRRMSPAEEFWLYNVLNISGGIDQLGEIRWELVICLAVGWIIVLACLWKGVKSSGKVVYVTATVPYIFLTILLIRGLTLDGAVDGIKYYLTPKWHKLGQFQVWCEACLQIFYSLGPAWGGLITMSSYNRFHNNCYRDAVLVPVVNCATSFYAGFVIFSVIGFMAKEAGLPIEKAIATGPGLAFSAYPEAIARLPISPVWAIMFFIMLLTLGLDSQFGMLETLTSSFVDEFPKYLKSRKLLFTIGVVIVEFLLGLPLISSGGIYVFTLLDWYCAAFAVTVMAFLECIIFGWIYGANRLRDDIELMIGSRPSIWWMISWCGITPTMLLTAIVFTLVGFGNPYYGSYQFPPWAISLGWCLASVSLIPIPVMAVIQLCRAEGTLIQRFRTCLKPNEDWGPYLPKYRAAYNRKYPTYVSNGTMAVQGERTTMQPFITGEKQALPTTDEKQPCMDEEKQKSSDCV